MSASWMITIGVTIASSAVRIAAPFPRLAGWRLMVSRGSFEAAWAIKSVSSVEPSSMTTTWPTEGWRRTRLSKPSMVRASSKAGTMTPNGRELANSSLIQLSLSGLRHRLGLQPQVGRGQPLAEVRKEHQAGAGRRLTVGDPAAGAGRPEGRDGGVALDEQPAWMGRRERRALRIRESNVAPVFADQQPVAAQVFDRPGQPVLRPDRLRRLALQRDDRRREVEARRRRARDLDQVVEQGVARLDGRDAHDDAAGEPQQSGNPKG